MGNFEKDFKLFASDRGVSSTLMNDYQNVISSQYIEPYIMEERQRNIAQISVFSRMFMERILFLGTEINSDVANIINSQLLYLEMDNPNKPITMYINSPGGSVYDGMSIYDVTKFISCPIHTTCLGTAASMAAVLLSSGDKGHRYALPHSQIMLHSPSGGTGRVTSPDFKIAAKEMEKCETMLYNVLAENMETDYETIKNMCDRDFWMTPEEAVNLKVIDEIIKRK